MTRRRFKSFASILSLIVIFLIGSTIAYFTSTDAVTNRLQSSNFDIILTESKWNPANGQNLMPNEEIEKNPAVTNLENTDAFVFLTVKMAYETELMEDKDGKYLGESKTPIPLYKFVITENGTDFHDKSYTTAQKIHTDWVQVGNPVTENNIVTYVYAYAENDKMTPLRKGESTPPLFDKIKLWNFNEKAYDHMEDVIVEAIGVRSSLFINEQKTENPSEIWAFLAKSEE